MGLFFNDINCFDLILPDKHDRFDLDNKSKTFVHCFYTCNQSIINQLILENPNKQIVERILDHDLFGIESLREQKKYHIDFSSQGFKLDFQAMYQVSRQELTILDGFIDFHKQACHFIKNDIILFNQEQLEKLQCCIFLVMNQGQAFYSQIKHGNLLLLPENMTTKKTQFDLFFDSWKQEINQLIEHKQLKMACKNNQSISRKKL